MKKKKNESGFTLVEVLIALSLVTLVVLSVAGLLGGLPRFYLQVREDEESGEIIETALSFIAGKSVLPRCFIMIPIRKN